MSEKTSAEKLMERRNNGTNEPVVDEDQEVEETEEDSDEEVETTEDQEVDESETEETEESEDEQEELPENIKDILKKNRKDLRAAKAETAKLRKQLEDKEPDANEDVDRFKGFFLKTAAKNALVEAGFSTGVDKFVRMIDIDELEVDENGSITGLEDQVAEIKEDFADVIAPPKKKAPAKTDAARRNQTPPKPKTSADILAERLKK